LYASLAPALLLAVKLRRGYGWYLMAKDEGRGLAKKKNAVFQFLSTILFFGEHRLK
jgi:hypothetical protein